MYKRIFLIFLMTETSTKQKTVSLEIDDKFSKNVTKFADHVGFETGPNKIVLGSFGSLPSKFPFKIRDRKRGKSWAENYADVSDIEVESIFNDYDAEYNDDSEIDPIVAMCSWRSSSAMQGFRCDCQQSGGDLVCCSRMFPTKLCAMQGPGSPGLVHHLYIIGLHQTVLDINQYVKKLKISPKKLKSITLRKTTVIDLKLFDNPKDEFCYNLTKLDLRSNRLASLQLPNCSNLQQLYLSGNNWQCIHQQSFQEEGENMEWLLDNQWLQRWKDESLTNCSSEIRHEIWKNNKHEREGWFDENNKHEATNLKKFLAFMKVMRRDCPKSCDCKRENAKVRTEGDKDKKEIFIVGVTCYRLNLTYLPSILPPNTISLDATENQISDLYPLLSNQYYKNLRILILENNQISSMEPLRNSKLEHINLRDNHLSYLDLGLLEPILEYQSTRPKNEHELNLLLSWNPWSCPCTSIRDFQNFLEKYHVIIKDAGEISCNQWNQRQLLDLHYEEICAINMDWMIILIVIEAFLLVSVLLKLTYDIVVYQRSGRLPWVARHLCCSALSSSTWWAGRGKVRAEGRRWWTWPTYKDSHSHCSSGYISSSGTNIDAGGQAHKDALYTVEQESSLEEGPRQGEELIQGEDNFLIAKTHKARENSVVRFV